MGPKNDSSPDDALLQAALRRRADDYAEYYRGQLKMQRGSRVAEMTVGVCRAMDAELLAKAYETYLADGARRVVDSVQ